MASTRKTSIAILMVLATASSFAIPTAAEESVPKCQTNFGPDGRLAANVWGMILVPEPYERVQYDNENISITPQIVSGFGLLAAGFAENRMESEQQLATVFSFLGANEEEVYSCSATVDNIELSELRSSELDVGRCDLDRDEGESELQVGQTQIFRTPGDIREFAGDPASVANVSTLSGRTFSLTGTGTGLASIVWATHDRNLGGLCYFIVMK